MIDRQRLAAPRSVVITGASSGIGAALAKWYAGPDASLALTGRDSTRLSEVADALSGAGATVRTAVIDSRDRTAMAAWLNRIDDDSPVDLVIANAGISAGTGAAGETEEQARRIFAVNLDGVLNTIHPLLDRMCGRGHGQIAIMSSLAAFRGFPGAPAYSASKAAVKVYGEALRGDMEAAGVAVTVITPGFVESRMTAVNKFNMPLLMTGERAASIIARGLAANKARIAFPFPTYFGAWLAGTLPPALIDGLLGRLPRKSAE